MLLYDGHFDDCFRVGAKHGLFVRQYCSTVFIGIAVDLSQLKNMYKDIVHYFLLSISMI